MSQPVAFSDVVAGLQARTREVVERYAPGGYVDGHRYWALNPGRADRHIGSFHVALSGAYAGRWRDESTEEGGDMLDLIQMALRTDRRGALDEAKRFLGIADETPAQREVRRRQAERAAAQRKADEARAVTERAKKRAAAQALFLRCQARLEGTPVAAYLAARGIGLEKFGRELGALRYHPGLDYHHIDEKTGEVFEGRYPAMVAAIYGPTRPDGTPQFYGVHRTFLAREAGGRWWKAPVPAPKKVLGSVRGGMIRIWAGHGPRGGYGAPLSRAPVGARLFLTEGIEDALSVALLLPQYRVAAAVSLGNLRFIDLPPQVTHVTLIRDNDPDPKTRQLADRARERFLLEGRTVSQWPESLDQFRGCKDINEVLMAGLKAEGAA